MLKRIALSFAAAAFIVSMGSTTASAVESGTKIDTGQQISHQTIASKFDSKYVFRSTLKLEIKEGSSYTSTIGLKNAGNRQNVWLQKYQSGKWVNYKSIGLTSRDSSHSYYRVTTPTEKPGTVAKYRLYVPAINGYSEAATTPETFTYLITQKRTLFSQDYPFAGSSSKTVRTDNLPSEFLFVWNDGKRSIQLQKLANGKWQTVKTIKRTKVSNSWGEYKFTLPAGKTNTSVKYRLHIPATSYYSAATSRTQTVKYLAPVPVKATISSRPFVYAPYRIASNKTVSHTLWVSAGAGRSLHLQMRSGSKWVTVSKYKTTHNSWGYVTVKTPKTTATRDATYRLYLPQSGKYTAAASPSTKLRHENPRHYTGYKASIYNYMKRYCPNTIITLDPQIGYGGSQGRGLMYWDQNRISVSKGVTSQRSLKYLSIHECAHILQEQAYKGDHSKLVKRMNWIYGGTGTTGMERNADCMAFRMGAPVGMGWYTNSCGGSRSSAAAAVLSGRQP